jgi:hypothetical protein
VRAEHGPENAVGAPPALALQGLAALAAYQAKSGTFGLRPLPPGWNQIVDAGETCYYVAPSPLPACALAPAAHEV